MNLSLNEHLILGIVAEQPRHGYDIEKLISERGMRKWTRVGFSSIYYTLEKLEEKDLVATADHRGKEKKQYVVTDRGVAVLKDKTKLLVTEREPANTHFMTGLAASDFIEASELVELLRQRMEKLSADLQVLQAKRSVIGFGPASARRLLSLSEALLTAELNWIEKEIERIEL